MIYCEDCARILDTDVQHCPYCNLEDENWDNERFIQDHDFSPAPIFKGEVFDKLREINQHIEQQYESNTAEAESLQNTPGPPPEESPGIGLYILMISLASCFSIAGLIAGIIMITKKGKQYQSLGIMTIVISLIFMIIGMVFVASFVLLTGNLYGGL